MALDEADDSEAEASGAGVAGAPVHRGGKLNIRHDSDYFIRVRRYLKARHMEEEEEEKIRLGALEYVLKDGILYYKNTNIQVILEKEDLEEIVEAIHKDLGHYWEAADVGRAGQEVYCSHGSLEGREEVVGRVQGMPTFRTDTINGGDGDDSSIRRTRRIRPLGNGLRRSPRHHQEGQQVPCHRYRLRDV